MTLQPTATALERMLAGVSWRVHDARQAVLPAGTALHMPASSTFAYVMDGSVAAGASTHEPLQPGDLLLTSERDVVRAASDARLVVAAVETIGTDRAVPPTLVVRGFDRLEPATATLAAALGCPTGRATGPRTSDGIVCAHMATTILAAAMRAWVEHGCAPSDWHVRSGDPFIARAIDAMHADPGRAWSVEALATEAAMSRSAFAGRFRELVGTSPLRYLTELRMAAAKRRLVDGDRTIATLAIDLGYASEEGFSRAFRRHVGAAPSQWRDRERPIAVAV